MVHVNMRNTFFKLAAGMTADTMPGYGIQQAQPLTHQRHPESNATLIERDR